VLVSSVEGHSSKISTRPGLILSLSESLTYARILQVLPRGVVSTPRVSPWSEKREIKFSPTVGKLSADCQRIDSNVHTHRYVSTRTAHRRCAESFRGFLSHDTLIRLLGNGASFLDRFESRCRSLMSYLRAFFALPLILPRSSNPSLLIADGKLYATRCRRLSD